jgi:hypothetical protein
MRYELFNRLNTGGSPLTDQEARNCIFRGTGSGLSAEIREVAELEILESLIKPTDRQKSQLYLDELVLRFYALLWQEDPKKNLGEHLTEYMRVASSDSSLFAGNRDKFERTLQLIANSQIDRPFQGANHQFSPSKYDGIMVGISENLGHYEKHPDELEEKISTLANDTEFLEATGVASNYKERVKKRILRAKAVFRV